MEQYISGFLHPLTPRKCHCGVGQIGQYFSDGEYSNYLFYEVSRRFNNLLPEQNPKRYSEKQLDIFRLIQSFYKDGLGYRRIAKVLNERGLTTEEGQIWKNPNVYSVIKNIFRKIREIKVQKKEVSSGSWKNVDGIYKINSGSFLSGKCKQLFSSFKGYVISFCIFILHLQIRKPFSVVGGVLCLICPI